MSIREIAAARGHTWDPWPCCSTAVDPAEWYRGRPKKTIICPDCVELIRLGKDARHRACDAGRTTFKWTTVYCNWPAYYGPYEFQYKPNAPSGGPRNAGDALRQAMFDLVNALSQSAPGHAWQSKASDVLTCDKTSRRISPYESETLVTMEDKVQETLDTFDATLRDALESAYREGKSRGQNILLNLAANELSVNDFNRRTAEPTE